MSVSTQISETTGPTLTKLSGITKDLNGWNEFMLSTSYLPPPQKKKKGLGWLTWVYASFWLKTKFLLEDMYDQRPRFVR